MGLSLSSADLEQLQAALRALLSPLDYPHLDQWRAVVNRAVKDLLGADQASFYLPPLDAGVPYSGEFPLEALRQYPERRRIWDERISIERRELTLGVVSRGMLFREVLREYYRSEYYNDYIVPVRAYDSVTMCVPASGDALARLLVHHDRPTGRRFGRRGVALLRLLLPAFKAGVQGRVRQAQSNAGLADHFGDAVRLCDRNGRTLHQNQAMTAMLGRGPSVAPLLGAINETVRALSRVHAVGAVAHSPPNALVRDVQTEHGDYQVRGSLLRDGWLGPEPGIVVSAHCLTPALPPEATIQEVFRLTEREAHVATLLARGRSNAEMAAVLGISAHTARHHTESVLLKLGVHARTDVRNRLLHGEMRQRPAAAPYPAGTRTCN